MHMSRKLSIAARRNHPGWAEMIKRSQDLVLIFYQGYMSSHIISSSMYNIATDEIDATQCSVTPSSFTPTGKEEA